MTPPVCLIAAETSIKTVPVAEAVLSRCSVRAALASDLTRDEVASLMSWCDWQDEALWYSLNLQEILNVYRASAEYDTFAGWLAEDRAGAIRSWNRAVISPANMLDDGTADRP